MNAVTTLAERVEASAGSDRELDREIKEALEIGKPWTRSTPEAAQVWALHYTSSIDAALTLVPEGWCFRIEGGPAFGGLASVGDGHPLAGQTVSAATPALALCAAALRAIASEGTKQ